MSTNVALRRMRAESAEPETPAPRMYRQGDVLLVGASGLPNGATAERRTGRIVLAEGEATGHAHAIAERDARAFVHDGERFVLVRSKSQLIHEEHAPIALSPGLYRVVLQREFEPPQRSITARSTSDIVWRRVLD